MGSMITATGADGHQVPGYLATADNAKGSVVVLQEWWGLNAQIKAVADRFAEAGFTAFVPDLYRGRVTQDADEANHMMTGLDWVAASDADVAAAVSHLGAEGAKVGVMGFCMGGALTLMSAARLDGISAAVCYYGIPPAEAADLTQISAPLLGHFATEDDWCSPAAVASLKATLDGAGIGYTFHTYEGDHAFFNEARPEVYVAEAAAQSWERTLAHLSEHLA